MHDEVPQLVAERERRIRELGPRPPWYRPFARRRWTAELRRISAMDVSVFGWMPRQAYTVSVINEMAERKNFAFTTLSKLSPSSDPTTGTRLTYTSPTEYRVDSPWVAYFPKNDKS